MLIIPADGHYTRGHLAVMTWALVALNVLSFLLVSGHDQRVLTQAQDYYRQSSLADREVPAYLAWLRQGGQEQAADRLQQALSSHPHPSANELAPLTRLMLRDAGFQDALDQDRLIRPGDPGYADWKSARPALRGILDRNWESLGALRADAPRPWTFFTYQFLHGGWGHLLGNMLMLVLVGRMVEGMVGSGRYLAVYLVTGALAGAAFIAVRSGNHAPLVGASGSIAGIMGLFTATFAQRRVRFFYAFFGVLGTAEWQALWLLPYWIGWELLQLAISRGAPVAYEAHVAGLIAGALASLLQRRLRDDGDTRARLDAPELDRRFELALDEAARLAARLHIDRARAALEQLHQQRPEDARPLQKLYALARLAPDSSEFHSIAARILGTPSADPLRRALTDEVRSEYVRIAQPAPNLPAPLLIDLLERAAVRGDAAAADRLLRPLLAGAARDERVHRALLQLAQKVGADKARAYRALAARHFSPPVAS